jgi:putative flippase GtrA
MTKPVSGNRSAGKDSNLRAARGIASHIPPGQFLRYLLVGGWNTVFGYTCFFLINRWLSAVITTYPYILAGLASSLINITVAFLGYKWFVFRTKGNYLREWVRTLSIYSGSILISTLALAPLVGLIRHTTRYQTEAPYIAGGIVAVFTVIVSFFGHKHFSFRKTLPATEESQSSNNRVR